MQPLQARVDVKAMAINKDIYKLAEKWLTYIRCDYECSFDVWIGSCHYNEVEFWSVLEC